MPLWINEIVTIAQAVQHLRLPTTTGSPALEDDDREEKLADAHALVLDYVADGKDDDYVTAMEAWDADTAPRAVRAAILRTFGDLHRFRGNDDDPSEVRVQGEFALSPRARQLLRLYRDPALA